MKEDEESVQSIIEFFIVVSILAMIGACFAQADEWFSYLFSILTRLIDVFIIVFVGLILGIPLGLSK